MKRICAFFLAIFVLILSTFASLPVDIYAADDVTVLSKSSDSPFAYSSSEAQAYVSAHKDIYDSENILLFSYTPTSTYNWTYQAKGKDNFHLSDNQLKAFLMSKKTVSAYAKLFIYGFNNNNVTRGLLSALGIATTGDSDVLTNVSDKLLGNYNYINNIDYDEDNQSISMSNVSGSVDKLRDEIKIYYMNSIGASYLYHSYNYKNVNPAKAIENIHSAYEYEEDYTSDYNAVNQYDFSISTASNNIVLGFDKNFSYGYIDESKVYRNWDKNYGLYFTDSACNIVTPEYHLFAPATDNVDLSSTIFTGALWSGSVYNSICTYFDIEISDTSGNKLSTTHYHQGNSYFFTKKGVKDTYIFKSYSALYNYVHGDQNAYLSSKIEETGKDISYSIKDMNENLGDKMDQLIDSINDKKESLSSDELQDAIDKGIEDLTKNTEDIKDNTSSILDILKEQNDILLQILGVTEYIAYNTQKDDGTDYTVSDLKNVFNTMYNGVGNAILYGKNTVTDSGSSAATQTARQSFKLSTAGAAASPDRAVVVCSADSSVATQDINNMDVHDGLFGKFPFSIPYQLYEWLQVLEADPVAPVFNYNYGFLIGKKNDPDCNLRIDLSIYEPWADQAKSFQRLGFTLLMALFIYNKFKGNSII